MGMIAGTNGVLLTLLAALPLVAQGTDAVSTGADRQSVALTLYNDNLALVKDTRRIVLGGGKTRVVWHDVSAQLRPETAMLRDRSNAAGLRVTEQTFDFDVLTPEKLLDDYVGREISVIRSNDGGRETRESAVVLSSAGPVLRFADRVEAGAGGRLAFPRVPETLHDSPTLSISLAGAVPGAHDLELSYLTGGLSWRTDYIVELNAAEDKLDLRGWATLTNQSGTAYTDATVQLVAGDLNRIREEAIGARAATMAKADMPEMQREALLEYHVYRLPGATTLARNQTKQVALMSATSVRVRKEFLVEGTPYYYMARHVDPGPRPRVGIYVEFDNRGEGLGIPLPAGVMRFYQRDGQGEVQFAGEDRIGHTPKNETVRVRLGDAFDLTADRRQTDFRKTGDSTRDAEASESAYEIELRNAKRQAAVVTIREPMPGDWRVLSESHPHRKVASAVAEWKVSVPAGGRAMLTYRVRIRN